MNSKKLNIVITLITPLFLTLLCGAVIFLASVKPYQKVKVILGIAFMDNLKVSPDDGKTPGLNILESDIDTGYSGETYEEGEIDIPSFGEQYAVLECSEKSFTVPVYWGSTEELLERGACHSTSSVVIGEKGNVVIDAHVDTFFEKLETIEPGDEIVLYTGYGRFTYEADKEISFLKSDKSYVLPKAEDVLTLYTCKRQLLGLSDARSGVTCKLVKKEFYKPQ